MAVTHWKVHVLNLTSDRYRQDVESRIDAACSAVTEQAQDEFYKAWNVSGDVIHDVGFQEQLRAAEVGEIKRILRDWLKALRPNEAVLYLVDKEELPDELGYHFVTAQATAHALVTLVLELHNSKEHLGCHPYSFVRIENSSNWTVTLSHEVLELLADPYVERFSEITSKGREYIYEVCDAVQEISYPKDRISVSDFVYPAWFQEGSKAKKFAWISDLRGPFEITSGGYIEYWKDGAWFETVRDGTAQPVDRPAPARSTQGASNSTRQARYAKNHMAAALTASTVARPEMNGSNAKSGDDFATLVKAAGAGGSPAFPAVKVVHFHVHNHYERKHSAGAGAPSSKDNEAISVSPSATTSLGLGDIVKDLDLKLNSGGVIRRPLFGQLTKDSQENEKTVESLAVRDVGMNLSTPAASNSRSNHSPRVSESLSLVWDGTVEDLKQKVLNCFQSSGVIDIITGLVKDLPPRIDESAQKLRENMQKSSPNAFPVPTQVIGEIGVSLTEGKSMNEDVQSAALKIALHSSLNTSSSGKIWTALKNDPHIGSALRFGLVRDIVAPLASTLNAKIVDYVYQVLSQQIKARKSLAPPSRQDIVNVIAPSATPRTATVTAGGLNLGNIIGIDW